MFSKTILTNRRRMRVSFIIVIVFGFLLSVKGQEETIKDTSCIIKEIDQFDGSVSFKMVRDIMKLDPNTILSVKAIGKKDFNIYIVNTEINSVDENSQIILLFTDGSKQKMPNRSSYNLNGRFRLQYPNIALGGGKKMLKELMDKRIKAIRLEGFSRYRDIEINTEISTSLNLNLQCFYKEWKMLTGK